MAEIQLSYRPLIERAQDFAARVTEAMRRVLREGRLSEDDLFDIDYQPVPGSDPLQYTNRALPALLACLPPLLAKLWPATSGSSSRCRSTETATSRPQRRILAAAASGEAIWNALHSRNQRIFDDRAGIMPVARNARSWPSPICATWAAG